MGGSSSISPGKPQQEATYLLIARQLVYKNPLARLRSLTAGAVKLKVDCPELEEIAEQLHLIDDRIAYRRVDASGEPHGRTRRVNQRCGGHDGGGE